MRGMLKYSATFSDACELEDQLSCAKYVAEAAEGEDNASDLYPVIYIEDGQGNQLNHIRLYESKLTDGSKVYHVELTQK